MAHSEEEMNISSENYESNSSINFISSDIKVETALGVNIFSILMTFPANSYVIWLIVTGTGNGLAADYFILNFSVCQIVFCLENVLICLSYTFQFLWTPAAFLEGLLIAGRPLFECVICVERYLAVVHPVTFLKYKPLRYRLMCSAVTWVAVFASGGFNSVIWLIFSKSVFLKCYLFCLIVLFLLFFSIQLFCCLAVLRALKQSGPGERGREREEENHMKRRAFNLILITTVTTVVIYTPYIILLWVPTEEEYYIYQYFGHFCYILAGLVQPVFFFYRVGKLNFIKCQ